MFGITQPIRGILAALSCGPMARTPKGPAPEPLVDLRAALAVNLRAHMAANPQVRGMAETAAAIEIGRLTGIGKNTILRALGKGVSDDGEKGDLRLDTLVRLAMFFGVSAQDLLLDHSSPGAARTHRRRANNTKNNSARAEGSASEVERAPLQRRRGA